MDDTDFYEGADYGGDAAGYEGDATGYEGEYADYPGEAAGTGGLPDGHWATDQSWVEWVDGFVNMLRSDPAAFESFENWVKAAEAADEPKFSGIHDRALHHHAKEFLARGNEQQREAAGDVDALGIRR